MISPTTPRPAISPVDSPEEMVTSRPAIAAEQRIVEPEVGERRRLRSGPE